MFVTISVLLDDLDVVKEQVYDSALMAIPVERYLTYRTTTPLRYAYTPVRVVVTKKGLTDIHVVEFTGCHYCVYVKPFDAARHWWSTTGVMPDNLIPSQSFSSACPIVYDYQPFMSQPEVRPLTEEESLLHDYVLTLAGDYFHDRFHLTTVSQE